MDLIFAELRTDLVHASLLFMNWNGLLFVSIACVGKSNLWLNVYFMEIRVVEHGTLQWRCHQTNWESNEQVEHGDGKSRLPESKNQSKKGLNFRLQFVWKFTKNIKASLMLATCLKSEKRKFKHLLLCNRLYLCLFQLLNCHYKFCDIFRKNIWHLLRGWLYTSEI